MTNEDKELLLRDLCARSPYGVKIYLEDAPNATLVGVVNGGIIPHCNKYDYTYNLPWNIEYVKPYLFPLSSMTVEQKFEFHSLQVENSKGGSYSTINECSIIIDWCNKNHFDYRGLIPMGLAIDATGLNIY